MHHSGGFALRERGPVSLRCHAMRKRGIQYSRGFSNKHQRLRNTGSRDPVYANRLRPKADFGGSKGLDGLAILGPPKL